MSESAAKKDIQKLQRAIVDGLEDVKAHDIRVFNTEHLSPLFERVIVASGSSNRQTKARAAAHGARPKGGFGGLGAGVFGQKNSWGCVAMYAPLAASAFGCGWRWWQERPRPRR